MELPENLFKALNQVSKEQFVLLAEKLNPFIKMKQRLGNDYRKAVTVQVMLPITLRMLAGARYLDLFWSYGIGRSTCFEIFDECLEGLNKVLGRIYFPITEQECLGATETYVKSRKVLPIKGVISSLHGIDVKIEQPTNETDPRKYFNRKQFFAIVVQAACMTDFRFSFASASHVASTHDSTEFKSSALYMAMAQSKLPRWNIAVCDDAYNHQFNLLCPYSESNLSTEQSNYNYYQSSCRIVIEQAFGMLVRKWGTFWSAMRFQLSKVTLIIMVCCKLHNFIMETGDEKDQSHKTRLPVHLANLV